MPTDSSGTMPGSTCSSFGRKRLWEEFRLDGAAEEYDLHMQDLADEEVQGTEPDLDRPPGLSEATVADIPRTTLSGLEAQNPELHRDIIIELQAMRDRDPKYPRISTHF